MKPTPFQSELGASSITSEQGIILSRLGLRETITRLSHRFRRLGI